MSLPRLRFPNRVGGNFPVPPQPPKVRITTVGIVRVLADGVTLRTYTT
jgi:hypothetical protein